MGCGKKHKGGKGDTDDMKKRIKKAAKRFK